MELFSSYCSNSKFYLICIIIGKPHGLRTARKLRNHRREQRWHDNDYKKSHLGTRWKSNPFGGASHAKGIVLEKVYVYFSISQLDSYLCSIQILSYMVSLISNYDVVFNVDYKLNWAYMMGIYQKNSPHCF